MAGQSWTNLERASLGWIAILSCSILLSRLEATSISLPRICAGSVVASVLWGCWVFLSNRTRVD